MWRSVVTARASLSTQAVQKLCATRNQRENLTPEYGLVGEEKGDTQMNIFSPSDVELGEVEEVYEIDLEQLESLLSLLQSSADGCLESSFDGLNLTLHPEFVIKVIETPLVLVKEVGEKENTVVHVEILNELISSFSKLGKGKAALEVFNKFGDFGCVPNADTYYFTIEALCRRSIFGWAESVCEKMLDAGILPDGEKVGRIISWFCKGKKAKDAHLVYSSAANVKPQYLPPASDVDGAKKLLLEMKMKGPPPGNAVFNMVINGYCKAGDMGEAIDMMNLMKSRGLKPDVYTYTVIMSGYTNGGQMEEACKILSEAKNKHRKLSPVTYHTLIRGYCKLEEFDKGLKLLHEMKDSGVQPNVDEYNKLIQSLCLKALDWETAEKLLEEMKDNGLHLKGITRGLIKAVKELKEEKIETENVVAEA
ncbi:pentatricopeptide repeat-containing protein [Prunus yedoensis var. nudiflora]|uniref:Pentatricopeptide repeat-containing protein n=1 Tax=Prunus yedoensis var. nudiflora TaxID=2094558 RepID=A0A314YX53_PRUYE|nr:pentatricopeptide repeat-containing protein [Prunus yedoensis var. nudiflora]